MALSPYHNHSRLKSWHEFFSLYVQIAKLHKLHFFIIITCINHFTNNIKTKKLYTRICHSVKLVSRLRLGFEADFYVMAQSRKDIYI
jgi:hypothetical protein